jgi:acyl phosphate:glycerol-3-phosphate acyltransferase
MNSIALNILKNFGFVAVSYIVGSIPFCYLLGKMVSGKKLTEIGDKNPGGWNLVFNVSKIWGFTGIALDMAKGYFAYFVAYNLAGQRFFYTLNTTENQIIALISGCAAIAGHNYSPFLKFKGGKGLATWGGFMTAINPWCFLIGASGLLFGILVALNMVWAVACGIIFTGIFLWILNQNVLYGIMMLVILLIMIPRQINYSYKISRNFKFRKESSLQDLFKPKIR